MGIHKENNTPNVDYIIMPILTRNAGLFMHLKTHLKAGSGFHCLYVTTQSQLRLTYVYYTYLREIHYLCCMHMHPIAQV